MLRRTANRLHRAAVRVLSLGTWLLLFGALAALLVFAIGPRTGAYRTLTVLSGSMSPTFEPGDSIIVVPVPLEQIEVGDVITYRIPVEDRRVVTHRIVRLSGSPRNPTVVTRGDANHADDPWAAQLQGTTAWVQRAHIPKAGYVIRAVRGTALQWLSLGALALFAVLAFVRIWRPAPGVDVEAAAEDATDTTPWERSA